MGLVFLGAAISPDVTCKDCLNESNPPKADSTGLCVQMRSRGVWGGVLVQEGLDYTEFKGKLKLVSL